MIMEGTKTAKQPDNGESGGDGLLLYQKKFGVRQAAELVGVRETSMRKFIRKGRIPALLYNGKYILLERDLEAFARSHYGEVKAAPPAPPARPMVPQWVRESNLLKRPKT